jgi:hypothetical protein
VSAEKQGGWRGTHTHVRAHTRTHAHTHAHTHPRSTGACAHTSFTVTNPAQVLLAVWQEYTLVSWSVVLLHVKSMAHSDCDVLGSSVCMHQSLAPVQCTMVGHSLVEQATVAPVLMQSGTGATASASTGIDV